MKVFTYSRARQELASILDRASREGEVRIRRRDGRLFAVQPVQAARSPLDVPGVRTAVTTKELVRILREGRRGRAEATARPIKRLGRAAGKRDRLAAGRQAGDRKG